MNKKFKISVIIPLLNEEGNINNLIEKLVKTLKPYSNYEIIFIDDGSKDKTLKKIKDGIKKNKKIRYISFSRNFGHQNALRAGLDYAKGDCIVMMDGDMQHPPELIPQLVSKWLKGYEIINTSRKDVKSISLYKRKTSSLFYKIINNFSDINIDQGAADFRLIDRKVVEILKTIREDNVFMRGMISWLGFKQISISYEPQERYSGTSKYTLKKMVALALSGITSFSTKPLQISTMVGYLMALMAFLYGIYAIYMKIFTNNNLPGWTSVLITVLFIGGIQMIMLGIVGEYIGRIFIESKKRPNYIIKEKNI